MPKVSHDGRKTFQLILIHEMVTILKRGLDLNVFLTNAIFMQGYSRYCSHLAGLLAVQRVVKYVDFAVVVGQVEQMLLEADFSVRSKGIYSAVGLLHRHMQPFIQ